jgi:iron(III) transport system substrate-binding protein
MNSKPKLAIRTLIPVVLTLGAFVITGCGGSDETVLTIYAGRSQTLVQPLMEQFAEETGIKIRVRYGDGTDLALGILEEGNNSPADIYYTQDVGALAALEGAGRLAPLSQNLLQQVPEGYRSPDDLWVGISGRARVMVYNTDDINPQTLPTTVLDYTKPEWRNRLGVVPRSDGFPEFVTALRLVRGDTFALQWLKDLKANNPRIFPNNIAAIQAVANNEIDLAFLNHYYLFRFLEERGEGFKARNYYFTNGDIGGIFLVSGAAILNTSDNKEAAEQFIQYLLTKESQQYFAAQTYEYPLVPGVQTSIDLPPIESLKAPAIDLSELTDLVGSLDMMREAGILP